MMLNILCDGRLHSTSPLADMGVLYIGQKGGELSGFQILIYKIVIWTIENHL